MSALAEAPLAVVEAIEGRGVVAAKTAKKEEVPRTMWRQQVFDERGVWVRRLAKPPFFLWVSLTPGDQRHGWKGSYHRKVSNGTFASLMY